LLPADAVRLIHWRYRAGFAITFYRKQVKIILPNGCGALMDSLALGAVDSRRGGIHHCIMMQ